MDERLDALRRRGRKEVAPLWIESLEASEALEALKALDDPVFRLQEARALLGLGRGGEARAVLERLTGLPDGLADVLRDVEEALGEGAVPLGEGAAAASAQTGEERALAGWLARVKGWRRAGRA